MTSHSLKGKILVKSQKNHETKCALHFISKWCFRVLVSRGAINEELPLSQGHVNNESFRTSTSLPESQNSLPASNSKSIIAANCSVKL